MPEVNPAAIEEKPKRGQKSKPKTAIIGTRNMPYNPAKRHMPQPGPTDMRRWFLHEQQGKSVEEIAEIQKVKPFVIQASLDYIQEWKFRNQTSMLDSKLISVLMGEMDGVGKVLHDGMKAKKVVHVNRETGKITQVDDHAMRVKVVSEVRALIDTVKPKTPALQLNQQFNNGTIGGPGYGPGVSFEAILRKKREERGLANSQAEEAIEGELSHADAVAEEFKDLGGGDDDEDEDDDAE